MTTDERLEALARAIAELKAINEAKRTERENYRRDLLAQERVRP